MELDEEKVERKLRYLEKKGILSSQAMPGVQESLLKGISGADNSFGPSERTYSLNHNHAEFKESRKRAMKALREARRQLLRANSARELLSFFFLHDPSLLVADIQMCLELENRTLTAELRRLVEAGILSVFHALPRSGLEPIVWREGDRSFLRYSLNASHPLYAQYKTSIMKSMGFWGKARAWHRETLEKSLYYFEKFLYYMVIAGAGVAVAAVVLFSASFFVGEWFELKAKRQFDGMMRTVAELPAEQQTQMLTGYLQSDYEDVRRKAYEALGEIGPAAEGAVPVLADALRDPETRLEALLALDQIGYAAVAAAPMLVHLVQDEDIFVTAGEREFACMLLGNFGSAPKYALPALTDVLLTDADIGVRRNAAWAISQIGPPCEDVASFLVLTSQGRDPEFLPSPLLSKMIVALCLSLGDRDKDTRRNSAFALSQFGPVAGPAVPALVCALSDRDGEIRQGAAFALGEIGARARSALPALRARLLHEDETVKDIILPAVEKIEEAIR